MAQHTYLVRILPHGAELRVPSGTLVSEALDRSGHRVPLDCGGKGKCGRCRVTLEGAVSQPDNAEQKLLGDELLGENVRLACRATIEGEARVTISDQERLPLRDWSMEDDDRIELQSTPIITAHTVRVTAPSQDDLRSDARRVLDAVSDAQPTDQVELTVIRRLTQVAREQGWELELFHRGRELIGALPAGLKPLGVAVDLGSTKLEAFLIDLETAEILAAKGALNPQAAYGADVVTRLQRAMSSPAEARQLAKMLRETLATLVGELARAADVDVEQIAEVCVAGNSAIAHLFLELPAKPLAAAPYVSAWSEPLDIKAREVGLELVAPGAYFHCPPQLGGYVGADNVAMILGAELDRPGPLRLGLDIGTNTELVLALPDADGPRLFVASAPSGPALEGAHLSSGMRAVSGAIRSVTAVEGGFEYQTMLDAPPSGFCGSGVIDAVAALRQVGLLDERGHFDRSDERVRKEAEGNAPGRGPNIVFVTGDQTADGHDLRLNQRDISEIQLAKSAIRAAALTLLDAAGVDEDDVEEIILAGSFGSHIDVASAKTLGLLPDVSGATYRQVGNAAARGVKRILVDAAIRARAAALPEHVTYVELTATPAYNKFFARHLRFPEL